ncbi:hypothetical protein [Phocaeicola coprocola]|uniref:hypothetical protein n=1 Tax=Phocaeicola coprocola TaxID=310298 RepID=UPI00241EB26E|nr:hypothetical protein [Phocaeicola coprocola]
MKKVLFLINILLVISEVLKAQITDYNSLDTSQPIEFLGSSIRFKGQEIKLGEKVFFVDGQLSNEEVAKYPYVFNTFQDAVINLKPGTELEPMKIYLAPYVYWIDNPDDLTIRKGKEGREPIGLTVKCPNLHIIGLNSNPKNIVLASNRGQTQGAIGNFTMFDFWGDGLIVKNLTMGNFCNVDLEFPLKKELARKKRMSAITQAHVAYCHGDKIIAENVRFISRLNMNPLGGAKRILFNKCHMENTDDALTSTGVYLNCTLEFYGQKPFWRSDMGGAIFLNCDFYICHNEYRQYFCKSVGPLSIVDCRFHVHKPVYIGWTHAPTDWLRCYQYNIKLNNQPYIIGADKPYNTICMDYLKILDAYRLEVNNKIIYNTYNLLCGDDGWDPLNIKNMVEQKSKSDGRDYANIATCLSVSPLSNIIQTGDEPTRLKAQLKRHCNYILNNTPVRWKIQAGHEKDIKLSVSEGYECIVTATNIDDRTKHINVIAYTDDGLECATELTVKPNYTNAPTFSSEPILKIKNGQAEVNYELELEGRKDESLITWYRCLDKNGKNAIPVSVSRLNTPEYIYKLTKEDVGYYLMVTIAPKHLRCLAGAEKKLISKSTIKKEQVNVQKKFETDFHNFPCNNQPQILPGFWTIGGYKPLDTSKYDWQIDPNKEFWIYGSGINGAIGTGLLQNTKGARMLYTPLIDKYGDMKVIWYVDPSKTEGQGFGSATGQYLDLYIKFDTQTLSGYGLRIIRTTKYSNAVDFVLMKYTNGKSEAICEPVSSTCYRTNCTISLKVSGNELIAQANTTTDLPAPITDHNLKPSVFLKALITPNQFGGVGIQHTGSCGESTTMLHKLKIEWK